jgi:hypothetical protein
MTMGRSLLFVGMAAVCGCSGGIGAERRTSEGEPPTLPSSTVGGSGGTPSVPTEDGADEPLGPSKGLDELPSLDERPENVDCELQKADAPIAFCESFDVASPGGRGGDLNESIIGITRLNNDSKGSWGDTLAVGCGETDALTTWMIPDDHFICEGSSGNHLRQAYDDRSGFTSFSMQIRQPFDFEDRTGTVAFDVDAWSTNDHGTWIEFWLTDEPVPAPYQGGAGIQTTPRNAIGMEFKSPTLAMNFVSNVMSTFHLVQDYNIRSDLKTVEGFGEPFATEPLKLNHFEIRVDADAVEVYVSDKDATEVHPVARVEGLGLGFSRGYVHVQHSHYNAGKDGTVGVTHYATHLWDKLAFDGPVLATPRFYDVPDSLEFDANDGRTRTAYSLPEGASATLTLDGVDLTNAAETSALNLMLFGFSPGRTLQYRFNDGTWSDFPHPSFLADAEFMWRTFSIPFDTAALVAGKNTLELRVEGSTTFTSAQAVSVTVMPTE